MLFHIEADHGTQIVGWLMPDNPSETPSVLVLLPDGKEVEVAATLAKPDVIETLRDAFGFHHTTGTIGFLIDETILPGLAELQEFEIVSKDGRVPIIGGSKYQGISKSISVSLTLPSCPSAESSAP